MKNLTVLALILFSALASSGCALYSTPLVGGIYTNVKSPSSIVVVATGPGTKTGRSECVSYLGLVAKGDCGIEAAMKNGGIGSITHIDHEFYTVLGIYSTYTTVITGD